MKHLILFLLIASGGILSAQWNPLIGSYTIIPASPTHVDNIKIVTHVTTMNQGVHVGISHSVTQNPKKIYLEACFWEGMLTALDEFVDTFYVGQLPSGNYTIQHKLYRSQAMQWCNKIDSASASSSLNVINISGVGENKGNASVRIFPNPVLDRLSFSGMRDLSEVLIYSASGILVRELKTPTGNIDVSDLPAGVYSIRFLGKEQASHSYFVKIN